MSIIARFARDLSRLSVMIALASEHHGAHEIFGRDNAKTLNATQEGGGTTRCPAAHSALNSALESHFTDCIHSLQDWMIKKR